MMKFVSVRFNYLPVVILVGSNPVYVDLDLPLRHSSLQWMLWRSLRGSQFVSSYIYPLLLGLLMVLLLDYPTTDTLHNQSFRSVHPKLEQPERNSTYFQSLHSAFQHYSTLERTMDSLTSSLGTLGGRGSVHGGRGKEAASTPEIQHLETQPSAIKSTTNKSTEHNSSRKGNQEILQQQSSGQRKALPTGRPAAAAQDYNNAAFDSDSPSPAKPAFTRGISVIDQTAVTSTAPTPAGEIQNPMSFGVGRSMARQRESHLPDEDLRERVRSMSKGEAFDDAAGDDEFGDALSRQETEKGR